MSLKIKVLAPPLWILGTGMPRVLSPFARRALSAAWIAAAPFVAADTLSPAQEWRQHFFGTVENAGIAANTFDANGNGRPNLLERALGGNPVAPSGDPAPPFFRADEDGEPDPEGAFWATSVPRIAGGTVDGPEYSAAGIRYRMRWSNDLTDWRTDELEFIGTAPAEESGMELARFRVPAAPGGPPALFRLTVEPEAPVPPAALSAAGITHEVATLLWEAADEHRAGWRVQYSPDGNDFEEWSVVPAGRVGTGLTGLTPGATHHFRVLAFDGEGGVPVPSAPVVFTTLADAPAHRSVFHIGNSLTLIRDIPRRLADLAQDAGYVEHARVSSMHGGWYLHQHWLDDDARALLDYGTYDTLILQGRSNEWSSGNIGDFITHAQLFHAEALANRGARTWIYSYWPGRDTDLQQQRYISRAFEQARAQLTGGKWPRIIPVGDAIEHFIHAREDGLITGMPRNAFYSDAIHQTGAGAYFTALVHFAAVYGQSPVGLSFEDVSADLALEMQETVWEFIQDHPYAGIRPGIPRALVSTGVTLGTAPLTVTLDASASYVPDGSAAISSVAWTLERDADAGPPLELSGIVVEPTLDVPGTYRVTAAVTSDAAESHTGAALIRVFPAPADREYAVGVNFSRFADDQLPAAAIAGLVPQARWNNYLSNTGETVSLHDSEGTHAAAVFAATFFNRGFNPFLATTLGGADFDLLRGWARTANDTPFEAVFTALPAALTAHGFRLLLYANAFDNNYTDAGALEIDWGNDGSVNETHTALRQWSGPTFEPGRPGYEYTDRSGDPQFHHTFDVPPGHTALRLRIPPASALGTQFVVSALQLVANPPPPPEE